MTIDVRETGLPGVLILEPTVFRDERGFFTETFSTRDVERSGIPSRFLQDNHSRSASGVLRGMHYQLSQPQGKLVHVARGRIFDVALDIRVGSPHFGRWFGACLDDENLKSLWIPPGFAHGFCVLSDAADVMYKCTTLYDPADDHGVAWNDPEFAIDWPVTNPVLSAKDSRHGLIADGGKDLPFYAP